MRSYPGPPAAHVPQHQNIKRMAALVIGATGFLGRQVVKAFERKGWKVTGTGYTRASPPSILKLDLNSTSEIEKVLEDVK